MRFRRNQSEPERHAEIQRHAESLLFVLKKLIPVLEADQPDVAFTQLRELEIALLRIPKQFRRDAALVVAREPVVQYASGLVEIYRKLNLMIIHNEHDHLHGHDRQPDRA